MAKFWKSKLNTVADVSIGGDLTVAGDDITMGTNTSGAVLVGDGTNFNPVLMSGDATISSAGALTLAANSVDSAELVAGSVDAAHMSVNSIDSDSYVDGSIDPEHIATGAVQPVKIAGLAHTASTVRIRTPQYVTINYTAASFDANDDLIFTFAAGHDVLLLDMFVNQTTAEGGALTATLRDTANGGGAAISASVDLNSAAKTVLRPTTFEPTAIAASGSAYLKASANPATTAGAATLVFVYTT